MNNTIENLRKYNLWRRGDESIEQPDPKDIGIWIDEICEIAEKLERERDEAREQNAKLRDIAGGLAAALERLDALYRSEQDPEAPMPRPDWLRRPLQMLDAELDQLKEGAK
jgi:hypothetical protein